MNRAIFLDRDGVVIEEKNLKNIGMPGQPITEPKHAELLPGVVKALKNLDNSYLKIIITNQANVGRGIITKERLDEIHQKILSELHDGNIKIDGIIYCPHKPEDNCKCRKPEIGMIKEAKKRYGLELSKCWIVGDATSDIKTGENAGMHTILVRTGYGGRDKLFNVVPEYVVDNLDEAVKIINSCRS